MPRSGTSPEIIRTGGAEEALDLARKLLGKSKLDIAKVEAAFQETFDLLLEKQSSTAEEIRREAVLLFGELIARVPDIEIARSLITKLDQWLVDQPDMWEIKEIQNWIALGIDIRSKLELPAGRDWPDWFGKQITKEQFEKLLIDLNSLKIPDQNGAFTKQLEHYRQSLFEEMLPAYLNSVYEESCQSARRMEFALALQSIDSALKFVPDDFKDQLPADFKEEGLIEFWETLNARLVAEETLGNAVYHLITDELSFQETVTDLNLDIPSHPNVPVEDLVSLWDDLKKAARIEKSVPLQVVAEEYVKNIKIWREFVGASFSILRKIPAFFQSAYPYLRHGLLDRFEEIRSKPEEAIRSAIVTMASGLQIQSNTLETEEPRVSLISLYWQLYWCLMSGIVREPALEKASINALESARELPHKMVSRIGQVFKDAKEEDDFIQLQGLMDTIPEIDKMLKDPLEATTLYRQLSDLLPIPDGKIAFEENKPIDFKLLQDWSQIQHSWNEIVESQTTARPKTDPKTYFERSRENARQFIHGLERLKIDVLPGLDIGIWDDDSMPARLEKEAKDHLKMVDFLDDVDRSYQKELALDELIQLSARFAQSNLGDNQTDQEHLWLLEKQRVKLKGIAALYRKGLHERIQQKIAIILKDDNNAPDRLRNEVLLAVKSVEVAGVVDRSIRELANLRSKKGHPKESLDEAKHFWLTVRRATQPWGIVKQDGQLLKTIPEEVNSLWRQLSIKSWQETLKSGLARYRYAIIGSTVVIFLLLSIWAWQTIQEIRQREEEARAQALILGATSTAVFNITGTAQAQGAANAMGTESAKFAATQEAVQAQAGTATSIAGAALTATQHGFATQAEATAQYYLSLDATATASICRESAGYVLELSSAPDLIPKPGTVISSETLPITATITWEVTNTGFCEWSELSLQAVNGSLGGDVIFHRDGGLAEITPDQPVKTGESVEIVVVLELTDAYDADEEWMIVANGIELPEQPHLRLNVEEWVVFPTPRPPVQSIQSTPTPTEKKKPEKENEKPPPSRGG